MSRRQLSQSNVLHQNHLVCHHGILSSILPLSPGLKFGKVPVVVTLHFEVEDLGLRGSGRGDKVGFKQLENAVANLGELSLDLATVVLDECDTVLVTTAFLLLLNGGDNAP
ncbi:Os04g0462550 [Oryza sativa Japonica Group]|uniref:Os04g0462550 protein n=1 Tax=Oryza sativa subsp. japonica TaxID=39947 RepID=A0A0P0WB83_ORYSJ|nr:hypothetical protein EE612_023783 [Oryza sativa]BAS89563.1 Os04g0462550 [Oryza sativa Japonica Group]